MARLNELAESLDEAFGAEAGTAMKCFRHTLGARERKGPNKGYGAAWASNLRTNFDVEADDWRFVNEGGEDLMVDDPETAIDVCKTIALVRESTIKPGTSHIPGGRVMVSPGRKKIPNDPKDLTQGFRTEIYFGVLF
ncbi:hypothetical protein HOE67_02285 [Candidatus Peregrinibacteria bacterium]|jgi:hypothetical protein|nr:hypothetical protein [Candidatus Peregrinibacteria bacterium]MBT4055917.1 hypothetical protein [Candidatus Peregrinibacteria bacterium]